MLTQFSEQLADVVAHAATSVVQVQGQRRPATGVVFGPDLVITPARAIGREEHPRVRRDDGQVFEGEVAGWDPSTRIVVVRATGLGAPAFTPAAAPARVGHLAVAVARSWSNAVTASLGLVSVIGGPLATSHRRSIERVIRTSAPMHEGFAGGAFLSPDGGLVGVTTAASIRGLGVVIPADIAWASAQAALEGGTRKRGYVGIAAQTVGVTPVQRTAAGSDEALLVVAVKDDSPAAAAGLLVGDLLLSLDGHALASSDELLDLLTGDRVGRAVPLRVLRGGTPLDVAITIAERSA
jgi:S1-C subfamily serine protease